MEFVPSVYLNLLSVKSPRKLVHKIFMHGMWFWVFQGLQIAHVSLFERIDEGEHLIHCYLLIYFNKYRQFIIENNYMKWSWRIFILENGIYMSHVEPTLNILRIQLQQIMIEFFINDAFRSLLLSGRDVSVLDERYEKNNSFWDLKCSDANYTALKNNLKYICGMKSVPFLQKFSNTVCHEEI